MADELVHRATADGVATITLDSPRNRNALSAQVRRELQDHLDAAAAEPAVRVIVLTHTGPVFCSGMDLRESRGAAADAQGVNEFPRILSTIRTSPIPVVARCTCSSAITSSSCPLSCTLGSLHICAPGAADGGRGHRGR